MIRNIAALVIGALLLTGCVYPYETAFETCDSEAGACYRWCEAEPVDGAARACRLACEDEANRCFDDAYRVTEYSSAPAYRGSWYGSFGYWRPRYGYSYDDYYDRPGRRYDRYDDRRRRDYRGRPRDGGARRGRDNDARRGRDNNDQRGRGNNDARGRDGNTNPGVTPPPTRVAPPPPPPRPVRPQTENRPLTRDPQAEPRKDE